MEKNFNLQLFAYDSYCDFSSTSALAVAGKDILLQIWDSTGTNLLAVAGQQSLTINRSAEVLEVSCKDVSGSWKGGIAGMKEWSIETGGLYVSSDESHQTLSEAFEDGDAVCIKVINRKLHIPLFGGIAYVTEYNLEAPHDDSMTYSITLSGNGALVILSEDLYAYPEEVTITKPSSGTNTETVTLYNVEGTVTGTSAATGVTATVSTTAGVTTATISVASTASEGTAEVTFTDATSTDTCTVNVNIVAA